MNPSELEAVSTPKAFPILNLQRTPESWNRALGGLVLGSLMLYLKGMRIMMFQLSGVYYTPIIKDPA